MAKSLLLSSSSSNIVSTSTNNQHYIYSFSFTNNNTPSLSSSSTPLTLDYLLRDYWNENGDPRVASKFLMYSFGPSLFILTFYSLFVVYFGPVLWMRNRAPYSLKPVLLVYNLFLSLVNGYFFFRYLDLFNYGLDMFNLEFPSFTDQSDRTQSVIDHNHLYMLSKFLDLMDTVFFVLRKKQSQITRLHFFHHLTVPVISWTHYRMCGNNHLVIPFQLLNSVIHTLMYGYYGIAAIGPQMQPFLWWKRYITQLQIVQFIILFTYATYFMLYQRGYAHLYTFNLMIQSLLYMYLFGNFYLRTYLQRNNDQKLIQNEKKKKKKKKKMKKNKNKNNKMMMMMLIHGENDYNHKTINNNDKKNNNNN